MAFHIDALNLIARVLPFPPSPAVSPLNDPAPPYMAKMHTAYNVQQHVAIGITSGLLALTTLVVYLRLHIRCVLLSAGPTGWDDLTVFIAWVS